MLLVDDPLLPPSLGVEGRKAAEAAFVPLTWEEDLLEPEDCDWVCLCWLGVDFWFDPEWDWVCPYLFWEDIVEGGKLSPKIERRDGRFEELQDSKCDAEDAMSCWHKGMGRFQVTLVRCS